MASTGAGRYLPNMYRVFARGYGTAKNDTPRLDRILQVSLA